MHLFLSALLHLINLRRRPVHPPAVAGATRTRAYSRITVVATPPLRSCCASTDSPYSPSLFLLLPLPSTVISHYLAVGYSQTQAAERSNLRAISRAGFTVLPRLTPSTPIERGTPIKFSFIIPEEDAKCRAHQGHEAVCLRSIGPPLPTSLSFTPRLCPSRCAVYSVSDRSVVL